MNSSPLRGSAVAAPATPGAVCVRLATPLELRFLACTAASMLAGLSFTRSAANKLLEGTGYRLDCSACGPDYLPPPLLFAPDEPRVDFMLEIGGLEQALA